MKPLYFVGTARSDLAAFPDDARKGAGYDLFMVQVGREPMDSKALPSIGAGAYELRIRGERGAFRVIYVAKLKDAVYVLHAFQKKAQRTARRDVKLATARYRMIRAKR